MEISGESNLVISRKDISLESELARGRFAVIFLAKYYNKREAINVAAKTLKGTDHKMRTQTTNKEAKNKAKNKPSKQTNNKQNK
jgi:predicted Ser/Thr protein kinase